MKGGETGIWIEEGSILTGGSGSGTGIGIGTGREGPLIRRPLNHPSFSASTVTFSVTCSVSLVTVVSISPSSRIHILWRPTSVDQRVTKLIILIS